MVDDLLRINVWIVIDGQVRGRLFNLLIKWPNWICVRQSFSEDHWHFDSSWSFSQSRARGWGLTVSHGNCHSYMLFTSQINCSREENMRHPCRSIWMLSLATRINYAVYFLNLRCERISVPLLPHPLAFIVQKKSKVICNLLRKLILLIYYTRWKNMYL